jgi:hypothetical protein
MFHLRTTRPSFTDAVRWLSTIDKHPHSFWKHHSNQREFVIKLKNQLNSPNVQSLAHVSSTVIRKEGGAALLRHYPTFFNSLMNLFPDEDWDAMFLDNKVPCNYWKHIPNQRIFLEQLVLKLGLSSTQELHKVSKKTIEQHGGKKLLSLYRNLPSMYQTIFPELNWPMSDSQTARISKSPLIETLEDQRKLLKQIESRLQISNPSEWNSVTVKQFQLLGGKNLLKKYPNFLELLRTLYPDYPWNSKDRGRVSRNYWKDPSHLSDLIRCLETQYSVKQPEDWYRISVKQILASKGRGALHQYGSLCNMLSVAYPNYSWDVKLFQNRDKRSAQRNIFTKLKTLFPSEEIIEEFIHPELSRYSGHAVEFDVFIPSKQIAVEYHGEHHYSDLPVFSGVDLYQSRDSEKQALCKRFGIKYVVIPYWEACTEDSLRTLIE